MNVSPIRIAAAAILVMLSAACTRESSDQYIASARDYMARADYASASIQARNAVQANPESAEARLLLGQALLSGNDPVGAESELRRALQLGRSADDVLPPLAQAMVATGKVEQLVKEFGSRAPTNPAPRARFQSALGDGLMLLRRRNDAERAYRAALDAVPGYGAARLGLAQLEAQAGKLDVALAETDAVIGSEPRNAQAHALKSDILLARRDRAGARKALEQSIQADASYLPARYALVSMLIEDGEFDSARTQLAATAKVAPEDVRLVYFQSALALRTGDTATARDKASQILKVAPDHVPSLVLMSRIELQSREFGSAEAHLRRVLAQAPQHREARRLLAASYLRSGQPAKARQTLEPMLDAGDKADPQVLLLAGEASLASGDIPQATNYYQQAAARSRKTELAAAHTRLGQIAMATGRPEDGVRELESAGEADPSFRQTDLALVSSHLRAGELDKALAAAKALEKKNPNDAMSHQVLGVVHLARRDRAAARSSFERALQLNPKLVAAARALAELDVGDRKADVARKRYDAMIAKDPRNATLHLAVAELQIRTGAAPADVIATLQSAVRADPSSVDARLALIAALARSGNARGALTVAQEAVVTHSTSPQLLQVLAMLQSEVGDHNQSLETLRKLAQLKPGSSAPFQRVAGVQAGKKQYDKAVETLRLAKELVPNDAGVSRDLIVLYLTAGRTEDALKESRSVQTSSPRSAAGWLLESQVHEKNMNFAESEKALRQGLKVEPDSGVLAARLHGTLAAGGKAPEAEAFVRKWLSDHPKDTTARLHLGDRQLAARNYRAAAPHYQAVIAIDPNNVVALNNLAWIAGQTNDPKALSYAERAVRLAPDSAPVLDTIGSLLVAKGEAQRGVDYLARAIRIAPDRADIRLNYAKGLVRAGHKDQARRELELVVASPNDFPGKSEASELLKTL